MSALGEIKGRVVLQPVEPDGQVCIGCECVAWLGVFEVLCRFESPKLGDARCGVFICSSCADGVDFEVVEKPEELI